MKNSKTMNFVISVAIFALVTLSASLILAFVSYKTGYYDAVGTFAGISVLAGSLCGTFYLKKVTSSTSDVLIGTGIFLSILMILSLVTSRSGVSVPFLVPVCCAAGGLITCFTGNGSSSQKVRRMVKKRSLR